MTPITTAVTGSGGASSPAGGSVLLASEGSGIGVGWSVALTVVLLAVNAFFVASEFALLAARRHRLEAAVTERRRGAASALAGVRELTIMLAGAQLGITMASLGLGLVSEPAFAAMLTPVFGVVGLPSAAAHAVAFAVGLSIVVLLHMVVGEMAPKSWAISGPERSAVLLAPVFRAFTRVVRPLLWAMNALSNALLRVGRVRPKAELSQPQDPEGLRRLVGESRRLGLIDNAEHDVLSGTLRAHSDTLAPLVVPPQLIDAVPASAGPEEIVALSRRHGRNRLLVREADGRLTGVLHVRKVLALRAGGDRRVTAGELASPVVILPQDGSIHGAVAALRERRASLAVVLADDGGLAGLVSLDDLLASMLGARAA